MMTNNCVYALVDAVDRNSGKLLLSSSLMPGHDAFLKEAKCFLIMYESDMIAAKTKTIDCKKAALI